MTFLHLWGAAAQSAPAADEDAFVRLIARERAAAALPGYSRAADLDSVARRHAERMAREGRMYHNQNLPNEVEEWEVLAENVGRGPEVDSIHAAFMKSDSHRREILSTRFSDVGMGVAYGHDLIWVAQVFRGYAPAGPPPPPPTTTVPADPEPAPAATRPRTSQAAPRAPAPARRSTPSAPVAAPPATVPLDADPATSADTLEDPGAAEVPAPAGSALPTAPVPAVSTAALPPDREVSPQVALAAGLLVLVVMGLSAQVLAEGRPRPPHPRDWPRRHRSQASMKGSRSPSRTAWTLPVS